MKYSSSNEQMAIRRIRVATDRSCVGYVGVSVVSGNLMCSECRYLQIDITLYILGKSKLRKV